MLTIALSKGRILDQTLPLLEKAGLSVSKKEQGDRFKKRETDPLKQYKLSPVDKESQMLWDKYTIAKFSMLMASNSDTSPWTIVRSDNKKAARINCIRHILNQVDYPSKLSSKKLLEDSEVIISGSKEIELMEEQNTFAKVS